MERTVNRAAEAPLLALDDDALRGDPSDALELALLRAMREERTGVAIAAPPALPAEGDAFVVHGIDVVPLAALRAHRFATSAIVVVSRADTAETFAATVSPPPQVLPDEAPDAGDGANGLTGWAFSVDLFDRLALPRKPGAYVVRVIVRDLVSNAVRTELRPRYRDPEVERFLRQRLLDAGPPPVWPLVGQAGARYGEVPEAPPVPAKGGIALEADRVVLLADKARCTLRGSFRLVAHEHEVVRDGHARADVRERRPTAVVAVPLVITGSAFAGPCVLNLALPSYDPVDPSLVVTGRFELDLLGLPGMARAPQTNFLYAVRGEHLASAVAALVTPDMLP
jgi:hypothetical protein